MAQVTTSLSENTEKLLDGAVLAGIYTGRSDGIREALRTYFRRNPELTQKIVLELYNQGEIDYLTAKRIESISAKETSGGPATTDSSIENNE